MASQSAVELITPAIERTKQYLFKPFTLGRFVKLALVAALTEGGMSSCNINSHSGNHGAQNIPFHMPPMHTSEMSVIVAVVAALVFITLPLCLLIGYLLIRLRFSFFDCVLHRQDRIGAAWSRYHRQSMRYLGLSLCVGLAFFVILIPIGFALYHRFAPLIQSIQSGVKPEFADFLPLIGIVVPLALLLAIAAALVDVALGCFVLPRMALEDASIGDALSEVWRDIQDEPGQFIFFIVLRFLVTLAASIVGWIALLIPLLIVSLMGIICALVLKSISTTLAISLGVPAAILVGGFFIVAGIGVSGTIGTFRRNYALLFYGGRYPLLGSFLQPVVPTPPLPPWAPGITPGPTQGAAGGA